MVDKREMKRVFALSKQDIYFIIVILMLALVMYWTSIVVQPTLDILENQKEQTDLAIKQQDEIIDNQNNNTERLEQSFDTQEVILQTVQNQSDQVSEAVDYFSDNINQTYFQLENTERMRSMQILNNLTGMRVELNEAITELEAVTNGTALTEQEKIAVRNLLVEIRDELERLEVEAETTPVQRQTTVEPPNTGGQISSRGGAGAAGGEAEPVIINQTFSTPVLSEKEESNKTR